MKQDGSWPGGLVSGLFSWSA